MTEHPTPEDPTAEELDDWAKSLNMANNAQDITEMVVGDVSEESSIGSEEDDEEDEDEDGYGEKKFEDF